MVSRRTKPASLPETGGRANISRIQDQVAQGGFRRKKLASVLTERPSQNTLRQSDQAVLALCANGRGIESNAQVQARDSVWFGVLGVCSSAKPDEGQEVPEAQR